MHSGRRLLTEQTLDKTDRGRHVDNDGAGVGVDKDARMMAHDIAHLV